MGVLSGVALLNYAYETMFQAFALAKEQDRVIHALRAVSYTHLDVYKRQIGQFSSAICKDAGYQMIGTQIDLFCNCLLYTSRCV